MKMPRRKIQKRVTKTKPEIKRRTIKQKMMVMTVKMESQIRAKRKVLRKKTKIPTDQKMMKVRSRSQKKMRMKR